MNFGHLWTQRTNLHYSQGPKLFNFLLIRLKLTLALLNNQEVVHQSQNQEDFKDCVKSAWTSGSDRVMHFLYR
jgi:hypothetical protein